MAITRGEVMLLDSCSGNYVEFLNLHSLLHSLLTINKRTPELSP